MAVLLLLLLLLIERSVGGGVAGSTGRARACGGPLTWTSSRAEHPAPAIPTEQEGRLQHATRRVSGGRWEGGDGMRGVARREMRRTTRRPNESPAGVPLCGCSCVWGMSVWSGLVVFRRRQHARCWTLPTDECAVRPARRGCGAFISRTPTSPWSMRGVCRREARGRQASPALPSPSPGATATASSAALPPARRLPTLQYPPSPAAPHLPFEAACCHLAPRPCRARRNVAVDQGPRRPHTPPPPRRGSTLARPDCLAPRLNHSAGTTVRLGGQQRPDDLEPGCPAPWNAAKQLPPSSAHG